MNNTSSAMTRRDFLRRAVYAIAGIFALRLKGLFPTGRHTTFKEAKYYKRADNLAG